MAKENISVKNIKVKAEVISKEKEYTGIVISPFKTSKKGYKINDIYKTKSKFSYDTLVKSKRIK